MLVATGVLATALGIGGAPPGRGSAEACTAAAVRAIEHRVPLSTVTAQCRGLSRAQLNFALGRAIYEVAGTGHHKTAWRRRAVVAGDRLARLIESQRRDEGPPARPSPGAGPPPPPPGALAGRWGEGLAALAAWLLTIGSGAFMLAGWIRRGGLRPRGGRGRLAPAVTLGHFGVASTGLLVWIAYLVTGLGGLGWLAVGVLLAAAGLGMATLTVWSSRVPRARPWSAGTGAGPARRPAHRRPDRARPDRQRDDPAGPAHRGERPVSRPRTGRVRSSRYCGPPRIRRPVTEVGRIRIQNGCSTPLAQGRRPRRPSRWVSASSYTRAARPVTSTLHPARVPSS